MSKSNYDLVLIFCVLCFWFILFIFKNYLSKKNDKHFFNIQFFFSLSLKSYDTYLKLSKEYYAAHVVPIYLM